MPGDALLLAGLAACVHAGWNTLLAYEEDPYATTAVALLFGLVLLAPAAALDWHVEPSAWPFVAASSALELAYFWLLATGYSRGELSGVYPLVRGVAPVLVLGVSVAFLGASLSAAAAVGVVAIAAGIFAIRGVRRTAGTRGTLVALRCGCCLAGYTLVDKEGLRHAAPLPYLLLVLVVPALAGLAIVARTRGWPLLAAGARSARPVYLGGGMVLAYALTLGALKLAPAAPVSAVRESSVLLATIVAATAGWEKVSRLRLAGAAAIAGGIAAIALG